MDLLPSDEQLDIAATSAAFLAKELPIAALRARRAEASAIDPVVWASCARLGWLGLAVAEADGGVGYGAAEEALVFREIGRHLAPGPFLATTLGVRVALAAGCHDLAASMMEGDVTVGLGRPRLADQAVGPTVSGEFDVIDPAGAAYVLVVLASGAALVAADSLEPIEPRPCIDPGVRLGRVRIDGACAAAHVPTALDDIYTRASLLSAAMSVGIAEATRDMASGYAKARVQFAKPIGVHQAIKHRCAEMAVRAESATSQLFFAASSYDARRPDLMFQVTSAKIVAANAAVDNASDNIQLHGGIGYTFEYDASLYLERAHVVAGMPGSVRSDLARLMGLAPAQ